MNITIELTGIAPLADAINNLAEALKAGTKADEVIATAKTRTKKPKNEDASTTTEATAVVTNAAQAPAAAEKVEASPEPTAPTASATTPADQGTCASVAVAPTAEDARKAVLAVAKDKGHDAASALLGRFGAKKISELKADDFAALIEAAKAA